MYRYHGIGKSKRVLLNNQSDEIKLEEDLVYGLLKSSDLKKYSYKKNTRKYTIVTQTKVGQETSYIQHLYPETYSYLKKRIFLIFEQENHVFIMANHYFQYLELEIIHLNHLRLQFQGYINIPFYISVATKQQTCYVG